MSSTLAAELLNFLQVHDEGVPDQKISQHFGERYKDLVPVINELLRTNRLQLFTQAGSGVPVYRAIKEETANKLYGLGREQILVYQVIEKSGNKGIWKQDVRFNTNLPQQTLDKILKLLEQRLLIKSVRSIGSKTKKLYMLYDVIPAKEITGGPWYTDQEFDHEFVEALCTFILQLIHSQKMTDIHTINTRVKKSGISTVELSLDELELVLQTLIYDGKIEQVQSSVLQLTGQDTHNIMYKVCKPTQLPNYWTDTPCGVCPLINQCSENGVISPKTCEYMNEWLTLTAASATTTDASVGNTESKHDMTW